MDNRCCQACQCSALSDLRRWKAEAHQAVGHQDCGDGQKHAHDNRNHNDCDLPPGASAAAARLRGLRLPSGLFRRRRGHCRSALQALHRGGAACCGRRGRAARCWRRRRAALASLHRHVQVIRGSAWGGKILNTSLAGNAPLAAWSSHTSDTQRKDDLTEEAAMGSLPRSRTASFHTHSLDQKVSRPDN